MSYTIYEMLTLSSYSVFTQSGNGNTTFRATGLKPDTNYFFIVGASDASGLNLSSLDIIEGTTPAGPPASLTIQAFPTSVVAGSATSISVTALDALGKPSSNVDIELTASTGQSWMVPLTDGIGTVSCTFTTPEVVSIQATLGSIESQYESITVEAPQAAADSLWTGYAADPGSGVTAVGASWIEPTVSGPNGSKLSTWVGIDGWGGSTVEQCGVAATVVNGVAQYVAWYEFFGDQTPSNVSPNPNPKGPDYGQQNISTVTFPVYAGDQISASVSLVQEQPENSCSR